MTELEDAHAEYQALLTAAEGAHLATLGETGDPQASYAPCVWHDDDCYLFLSALSSHTGNLKRFRHARVTMQRCSFLSPSVSS